MNFVMLRQKDEESDRAQIQNLKRMAAEAGRPSQCWIHVHVVCRESEAEARAYLDHYVREKGDWAAVDNMLSIFGMQSETLEPAVMEAFRFHFIAGHGGADRRADRPALGDGRRRHADELGGLRK